MLTLVCFSLAFEGWLYRGRDNAHQALQSSVCSNGNRSNCEELKKVGISSIVMTVLLFIALLFTVVPLIVKKKGALQSMCLVQT